MHQYTHFKHKFLVRGKTSMAMITIKKVWLGTQWRTWPQARKWVAKCPIIRSRFALRISQKAVWNYGRCAGPCQPLPYWHNSPHYWLGIGPRADLSGVSSWLSALSSVYQWHSWREVSPFTSVNRAMTVNNNFVTPSYGLWMEMQTIGQHPCKKIS